MSVFEMAKAAKLATTKLQSLPEAQRLMALDSIANALIKNQKEILEENQKDLSEAKKNNLSTAMIDRMALSEKSIQGLAQMCRDVAGQDQVVGTIIEESQRPNGLIIQKQRIPIGVIGMIFESRPNVVVDGAALAIKSGNAIILKGGKEAHYSNRVLAKIIQDAIQATLPVDCITLIETRDEVTELLKLNQYVDLMVPRGGEKLIKFVREHATMPVVAHDRGLCHVYLHADADPKKAHDIVLNAKTQRPGVCNAMETLL